MICGDWEPDVLASGLISDDKDKDESRQGEEYAQKLKDCKADKASQRLAFC